jgi:hypothetical protein
VPLRVAEVPRQHSRAEAGTEVEALTVRTPTASPALRALVAGLVDYAGLFPPAGLDMSRAAAAYAEYLASADAWMLGRFVVPVARLDELVPAAGSVAGAGPAPWRLSALAGEDAEADARSIHAFNTRHAGRFVVDVAEARATDAGRIAALTRAFGSRLALYVEVPADPDPRELLEAVHRAGARAKIRTGGVTPDAFPRAAHVARFISRCAALRLPFKATAGLHHPLRGEHRLTYEPNSPSATMFGFVNVFVAGVLATQGASETELVAALEERNPLAFSFDDEGMSWRGHRASVGELAAARASFAVAFGSCSFREPVDDLQQLARA